MKATYHIPYIKVVVGAPIAPVPPQRVYEARDGYVFDWKEPHYDEQGHQIHLYVKVLYLGKYDSIDNYIEVPEPEQDDD